MDAEALDAALPDASNGFSGHCFAEVPAYTLRQVSSLPVSGFQFAKYFRSLALEHGSLFVRISAHQRSLR